MTFKPDNLPEASEIEIRMFDSEIRSAAQADSPQIDGIAAVYNKWSEDLGGFREMIEPGFFENVLKDDVRAFWNHDNNLILGRTRAKTLVLEDTERGLGYKIIPPDTQAGRDAVTSIKRGDVTQSSFSFTVKPGGDEWTRNKDGSVSRVLKRGGAGRLYDVSPVTIPAYRQTSVHARSMAELTGKDQPDPEEELARTAIRVKHANRKRFIQSLG
jgi:uncharacterized protein